ncbi:MAG TPA: hypothetical protein VGR90_02485, partial [Acidimicrobiales bacterium]|nr:hypothetical protein [Acidimicrobiales bacterium]
YGLIPDPAPLLDEAESVLRRWAEVAEAAWREGRDIAEALESTFAGDTSKVPPEHREKLETLNGVHSNAAGFQRWLETRDAPLEG